MLEVYFLRHGMTAGNERRRYIGVTDEPLCLRGAELLRGRSLPPVEKVFASPMRRCRESAAILYADRPPEIIEDLRECDFGEFENKNYLELSENPRYQQWIDSGGTLPFPGGESREQFQKRSLRGFAQAMETAVRGRVASAAVVAHGGTIMSVLAAWGIPSGDYYSWHADNGGGYLLRLDEEAWTQGARRLAVVRKID